MIYNNDDTIAAIATAPGVGAIGVVRLSGPGAIEVAQSIFLGKDLTMQPSHTLHFGRIMGDEGSVVDEVVAALYRNPKSYTGEDTVELSCHGSQYVLEQVLRLCLNHGARMAQPGEFTFRAFMNGRIDLAQAEAVADLIASQSGAAHKAAIHNLRGGFSIELKQMREQLIQFAALIELELDFSQEDVEFADRSQFYALINRIQKATDQLLDSFRLGNVIKNGVKVAIIGKPNAGKSTLLNALLNEDRAIVSEIAGTTRDTIEEVLNINGVLFRLIDTAGIREHTIDNIERQGIERSREAMTKADVVIYLADAVTTTSSEEQQKRSELDASGQPYILVMNKADLVEAQTLEMSKQVADAKTLFISAQNPEHIPKLKQMLFELATGGALKQEGTIITNTRHYHALQEVQKSLKDIKTGLDSHLPGDLLASDIHQCLYYLGEITGKVTNEDMLDYIFSKFCIGK